MGRVTDEVLLLHAMTLMSAADGQVESSELATLEAFVNTLPELKDADLTDQLAQVQALRASFTGADDAVAVLAGIQSEAIRKKAFILAADLALASGAVDEYEEALLESMQRVLRIDDDLASTALRILALKYAR